MTAFDWEEFLELAGALVEAPMDDASDEAQRRTAVSRAYYSAFCTARNVLEDEGNSVEDGPNAHADVVRLLNRSTDTERKRAGNLLKRLRNRRNTADYDDVVSPKFRKRSRAAVNSAEELVTTLTGDRPAE